MARSSSADKVAKAARTGTGGRRARQTAERNIIFPVSIALVALLGVLVVVLARSERQSNADNTPPLANQDHWHSAYGIFVCGSFAPNFPNDSADDRTGIHTHGQGLIHIHPFLTTVQGQNANLGVFMEESGVEFDDETLGLSASLALREGTDTCTVDGEEVPGEVRVVKWNTRSAREPVEVATENVRDIRFDREGQVFTIAFVAESRSDDDIPKPEANMEVLTQYIGAETPLSEPDLGSGDDTGDTGDDGGSSDDSTDDGG